MPCRQNTWATREAEAVHQSARAVLRTCGRCGVAACHALGMTEFYTEQGELQTTVPEGVYEVSTYEHATDWHGAWAGCFRCPQAHGCQKLLISELIS